MQSSNPINMIFSKIDTISLFTMQKNIKANKKK